MNCKLTALLMLVTWTSLPAQQHSWNQPPSAQLVNKTPGLVHQSFDSKLMKTKVGYSVVLPPGYDATSKRRYPVVYWLHGGGGNECSDVWTFHSWRKSFQSFGDDSVGEVILVYPNGGRSSYWDHHDGKVMMESLIVKELIPHVDQKYRTIAKREGRAIHGFSMGASGALKFAIKYPSLFCSAVAYGGGAIDLEKAQMPFIANILKRNLNSDRELVRKNNTYRMLAKNHARVRKLGIPFLLICGENDTWKSSATEFQQELNRYGIKCDVKVVPDTAHELGKLIKVEAINAAKFQDRVFRAKGAKHNSARTREAGK